MDSSEIAARLETVEAEARSAVEAAQTVAAVAQLRTRYLGRSGVLRGFTGMIAGLASGEEKAAAGQSINSAKMRLEETLCAREAELGRAAIEGDAGAARPRAGFDFSLPGTRPRVGRRHPVYATMEAICETFGRMGFGVEVGPEIETGFNNFEALNIPMEHPSRDAFDTFYLQGGLLLRSHTSPVQIRVMTRQKPPVRIVVPGKVFRPDAPDASHSPMFHQVEGLMVDEGVSFADLKGVLTVFARDFYGPNVRMRFRPSYFPFTEPSAEVDITCLLCNKTGQVHVPGCPVCKYSGWVEILGAGMVHPRVLEGVGYDAEKYTGFAFGMGVERVAMLKYEIDDIRLFTENNMAFLEQF
ncbi:MAG: phenylalanine--tRNA ligase subunit alpha [Planctomycetota bacterium]|nr:phenylalanine--tRNA ligase subunit alpha [Planctomycetota bacterium]